MRHAQCCREEWPHVRHRIHAPGSGCCCNDEHGAIRTVAHRAAPHCCPPEDALGIMDRCEAGAVRRCWLDRQTSSRRHCQRGERPKPGAHRPRDLAHSPAMPPAAAGVTKGATVPLNAKKGRVCPRVSEIRGFANLRPGVSQNRTCESFFRPVKGDVPLSSSDAELSGGFRYLTVGPEQRHAEWIPSQGVAASPPLPDLRWIATISGSRF